MLADIPGFNLLASPSAPAHTVPEALVLTAHAAFVDDDAVAVTHALKNPGQYLTFSSSAHTLQHLNTFTIPTFTLGFIFTFLLIVFKI